ncbi:MAG: helix-turn-helix domain-containing protein [Lachnospiraceae bacterium]|nr:helix-turn-helix domain-containing protein [Lachnospiraceae bacterium]
MYRILLGDDEGIMLESLRRLIEANYGNQCEVHCAKTGRAVIETAQQYPPDICFVDIHMPGISGIQAIREIKKFNQTAIFVIITAYDKFDYAQEAVNLGVMEFLTKPVNKRVLLGICEKAMEKVDERRKKREDDLSIREKLETVIPMIESGYINNLLLQDDFNTYQDNYRELLGIKEEYAYIIVTEFGDRGESGTLDNAVGASVKASREYASFREIVQLFFNCVVGPVMGNTIVLLVPCDMQKMNYEQRVTTLQSARDMVHKLEEKIDSHFRCGIGRPAELAGGMKNSYREAMKALRESSSHVAHIEDLPVAQKYDGEYPRELEDQFMKRALARDTAGTLDCAERFYEWMLAQNGEREDVEVKVLELVMALEKEAFMSGDVKYGYHYRGNYISQVRGCADLEELRRWFLRKVKEVCRNIENAKDEETTSLVDKARRYIMDNYRRDITLDEVSRQVDISPYYFSKLFKQEAGQNFIEFLTQIRMNKAKELLGNSSLSIKEICAESGYSDPNYFSRIFKKQEGITPREYRERMG